MDNSSNTNSNTKPISKKLERTCLECGKKHTHNNSFCSALHCKEWRSKNPNNGMKI